MLLLTYINFGIKNAKKYFCLFIFIEIDSSYKEERFAIVNRGVGILQDLIN